MQCDCSEIVKVVKRKSSQSPVQLQTQNPNSELLTPTQDWTGETLKLKRPPPHPTRNFSGTSRGHTTKCYTFLETSHDPLQELQLSCKSCANFLQPYFANLQYKDNMKSEHQVLYLSGYLS